MPAEKELGKLVELFCKVSHAHLGSDDPYQFDFKEIIDLMASLAVTNGWNVDKTVAQFFADRELPYKRNLYDPQWILAQIHYRLGYTMRDGHGNLMVEKDGEVKQLNEKFFQFDMEGEEPRAFPLAKPRTEDNSLEKC